MENTLSRDTLNLEDKNLLESIVVKNPSDLIESEIGILRSRRSYLTEAEQKRFSEVFPKKDKNPDHNPKVSPEVAEEVKAKKGSDKPKKKAKK